MADDCHTGETLQRLLAAATFTLLACNAFAAAYPEKPVRLVLPTGRAAAATSSRGRSRITCRSAPARSSSRQPRRRNGNIAMEIVAHARPTVIRCTALTAQLATIRACIRKSLRTVKDFAPITLLGSAPYVRRSTAPSRPYLAEFIKLARDKPAVSLHHAGNGSGLQPFHGVAQTMAKIDLVHVRTKARASRSPTCSRPGTGQFISYGTGVGHFKAGRLRALAATTKQRSKVMPDVPTIAEAGVPGYDSGVWYALLAHPWHAARGHQAPACRLRRACQGRTRHADGQRRHHADRLEPAELAAYTKSEIAKWSDVVKRSGATVDWHGRKCDAICRTLLVSVAAILTFNEVCAQHILRKSSRS